MSAGPVHLGWNEKSICIRCDTPVTSDKDFCSKECEDAFLSREDK